MDRRSVLRGGAGVAATSMLAGRSSAARNGAFVNSIALEDGRVWIAAKIGDAGPFFFAVDTGAVFSLIDDAIATRLKLELVRMAAMTGVGGARAMTVRRAPEVRLASGVRFPNIMFLGTRGLSGIGKDAAGLFGCGMFTTFDSDLDFERGEWRLYTRGRGDFAGLSRIPSRLIPSRGGRSFAADATVDGFAGRFVVDTGAPGELFLGSGPTRRSGLWRDDRPYAPARSAGIGLDRARARVVRLDRLTLGEFDFQRPLVTLNRGEAGSIDTDGLIGLAALSRLHLTADVAGQALWAAPNRLPRPRAVYPRTGLWVERRHERWMVDDVGIGSPGAAAGLIAGDELVEVAPATVTRMMSSDVGAAETVTVERAGKRRSVTVTPADYL